jgi:hypothetical protein
MLSRRGLITGLISFVAAPAIVRASSLMPVRAIAWEYNYPEYMLCSGAFARELADFIYQIEPTDTPFLRSLISSPENQAPQTWQ